MKWVSSKRYLGESLMMHQKVFFLGCYCSIKGSKLGCNQNGKCNCKDGFYGRRCEKGLMKFIFTHSFNRDTIFCFLECECNDEYTINGRKNCDQNGQCDCQNGFSDKKCNELDLEAGSFLFRQKDHWVDFTEICDVYKSWLIAPLWY